jgi:hypothetical protein
LTLVFLILINAVHAPRRSLALRLSIAYYSASPPSQFIQLPALRSLHIIKSTHSVGSAQSIDEITYKYFVLIDSRPTVQFSSFGHINSYVHCSLRDSLTTWLPALDKCLYTVGGTGRSPGFNWFRRSKYKTGHTFKTTVIFSKKNGTRFYVSSRCTS